MYALFLYTWNSLSPLFLYGVLLLQVINNKYQQKKLNLCPFFLLVLWMWVWFKHWLKELILKKIFIFTEISNRKTATRWMHCKGKFSLQLTSGWRPKIFVSLFQSILIHFAVNFFCDSHSQTHFLTFLFKAFSSRGFAGAAFLICGHFVTEPRLKFNSQHAFRKWSHFLAFQKKFFHCIPKMLCKRCKFCDFWISSLALQSCRVHNKT